ncbi:lipase maturation factor family protein [Kiritimatiellota bacterium B12222]|nr:lipase maturation factor family protein [Kiritimatiellota bacterium B12222]
MNFIRIHFLRRLAPHYGPHYGVAAQGCLRGLGLIYVISFWSLASQIVALSGSKGLLPASIIKSFLREQSGVMAPAQFPSLLWLSSDSLMLLALTGLGAIAGLCLLYGFYPWFSALLSWVCWVSLLQFCQPWMSTPSDYLTAEVGFFALFLLTPLTRFYPPPDKMGSHITGIIFLNGLLFKVLFSSGLAKLTFGSSAWAESTAFYHFFETQDFPSTAAWFVHLFPATLLKYGVWGMMFIEIMLPFYIFLPRIFRNILAGALGIEALILLITGNHGALPLLLLLLAFVLIDDVSWRKILPESWGPSASIQMYQPSLSSFALFIMILPLMIWQTYSMNPHKIFPPWRQVEDVLGSVHAANTYALFPTVEPTRQELSLQGSVDGRAWVEYRFKLKPTDPRSAPGLSLMHLPRLDQQFVQFAAGLNNESNGDLPLWLYRLIENLLLNDPGAQSLFPVNPFPDQPPRFMRLALYEYSYADPVAHREDDVWWTREFVRLYGPVFSLDSAATPQKL